MNPIAFELTIDEVTRPIGGYGLAIAFGMFITSVLTVRQASRAREDVGATIACCGYTIAGGIAGAWVTFLLVEWARTGTPLLALRQGGGLVFYGAVPGGALAAFFAARGLGVPFAKTIDLGVPGIAIGHAIGRVGCFLGGCCFGREHHGVLSVVFTHPLAPAAHPPIARHPVQLYEAGALALLALGFALIPVHRADGSRALTYVIAYGILRLFTESLRGDLIRGLWGPFSTSQIVSLALIVLAGFGLFSRRQRR